MRLILAALTCLAVATAAPAQTRITPDEFMDRAFGRTLTFRYFPDGGLVGLEEFVARDRSVWARDDGRCTYGEITLSGLYICFVYDDDPAVEHCWVPYVYRGDLIVRSTNGQIQKVTRITDDPVICEDAPMS